MEHVVKALTAANIKKAYLLINSPWRRHDSSYKIARALRTCLEEITTFVPHVAASGGTLLAMTGNKIVMGPMSHITPLDVQILYNRTHISAGTFMRFYGRALEWFETVTPEDAPYPQKALTDKLDPFVMEEWSGLMETIHSYVAEILELSGGKKCRDTAARFVYGYKTHGHVINSDMAKKLGLTWWTHPS
jgi:ClpP class serine protease